MAQQEIRAQRENELASTKKALEDERIAREEAIASMRSKHSKAMEELNEQLEAAKKVGAIYTVYVQPVSPCCAVLQYCSACTCTVYIYMHVQCIYMLHNTGEYTCIYRYLHSVTVKHVVTLCTFTHIIYMYVYIYNVYTSIMMSVCVLHHLQSKQTMEKGKSKLEGENEKLVQSVHEIRAAYAETDKRRKTAEAQLSESQAKLNDESGRAQDLSAQNEKQKV